MSPLTQHQIKRQTIKWRWQTCPVCNRRIDAWTQARNEGKPFILPNGLHYTVEACSPECTAKLHLPKDPSEMTTDELLATMADDSMVAPRLRIRRYDALCRQYKLKDQP